MTDVELLDQCGTCEYFETLRCDGQEVIPGIIEKDSECFDYKRKE